MATEFKLPELGENVESGDVVSVLVAEGDSIEEGQGVLELETDKATVEVPSEKGGVVKKIHVSQGDEIRVGDVILSLEVEQAEGTARQEQKEVEARKEKEEEGREEKQEAESPKQEPAREAASEAAEEEEAPEQKERETGPEEAKEETEKLAAKEDQGKVVEFQDRKKARDSGRPAPASPAVRRFAREIGVDINEVPGSGSRGRISVDDVKVYSKQLNTSRPGRSVAAIELPDFSRFGEIEKESFSNVRRKTAEHMATAWSTIPHVTQHDQADITRLEEARKRYAERVQESGGKLTLTAIALKVCAAALRVFPHFNASIDVANEEVIYKKYCHIGVAVDTERGLLVPVLRDVDKKNISELAKELTELAEKARNAKVGPDDLQGGCFTITNLGGIGGTSFTPIVNSPEVAILGISRGARQPVYGEDGEFEPRLILPLSLSYDHRLIDGADAARFLRWVASAFEDPFLISLEGH